MGAAPGGGAAALAAGVLLAGCNGEQLSPSSKANRPIPDKLLADIEAKNMDKGSPMLVRLFKQEAELEVWKQNRDGKFALLKTYPICRWSGDLGPKVREGDRPAGDEPRQPRLPARDLGPRRVEQSIGKHMQAGGNGCRWFSRAVAVVPEFILRAKEKIKPVILTGCFYQLEDKISRRYATFEITPDGEPARSSVFSVFAGLTKVGNRRKPPLPISAEPGTMNIL